MVQLLIQPNGKTIQPTTKHLYQGYFRGFLAYSRTFWAGSLGLKMCIESGLGQAAAPPVDQTPQLTCGFCLLEHTYAALIVETRPVVRRDWKTWRTIGRSWNMLRPRRKAAAFATGRLICRRKIEATSNPGSLDSALSKIRTLGIFEMPQTWRCGFLAIWLPVEWGWQVENPGVSNLSATTRSDRELSKWLDLDPYGPLDTTVRIYSVIITRCIKAS